MVTPFAHLPNDPALEDVTIRVDGTGPPALAGPDLLKIVFVICW